MDLRFDEELLGEETLDAGFYNQIRLIAAADGDGDPVDGNLNGTLENVEVSEGETTDLITAGRNIILD